jgi:hypothetical protein
VLLVEGPDDYNAFIHLTLRHGLYGRCTIEEGKGIDSILTSLPVRIRLGNEERLGIVLDTDARDENDDAVQRVWSRIRDVLREAGYAALPTSPDPAGTIVRVTQKPVIGIWLMPDNMVPGMLEDFCRFLIPDGDPLWARALLAVQSIPVDERHFPAQHAVKANIHTWLAWQEEPGKPIGQAITKKYLDADAPHALRLIAWLRSLFDTGQ